MSNTDSPLLEEGKHSYMITSLQKKNIQKAKILQHKHSTYNQRYNNSTHKFHMFSPDKPSQ